MTTAPGQTAPFPDLCGQATGLLGALTLDIPDSPPLDLSLLLQAAASALTPCTLPVLSACPPSLGWLLGTELAAGTCAPLPPLGNGVHTRGRVPACCPGPRGLCLHTWPCSKHADSLSTPPAATRVWPTHWDEDLRTTPGPAPGWQEPPSLVFPLGRAPPGNFQAASHRLQPLHQHPTTA